MIHARPVGITPLVFMHKIGLAEKSCASNHAWSGLTAMSPIYRNHVDGRGHTRATVPRQAQAASAPPPRETGAEATGQSQARARALAGSYSYSGQLPSPERTLTTQHDTFIFRSCGLGLMPYLLCAILWGIRAASTRHSIESPHMGGASTRYLSSTGSGGAGRRAG